MAHHNQNKERVRGWTFTDYKFLDWASIYDEGKLQYILYGDEICPTTKRRHFQGYLFSKAKVSMKMVKKITHCNSIHLEPAKTCRQAIDYCKKDKVVTEYGKEPIQGRRSDIEKTIACIKTGATMQQVKELHGPCVFKYTRNTLKFIELETQQRAETEPRRNIFVEVLWGEPGVGKTALADAENPGAYSTTGAMIGKGWWMGYDRHKTVIVDEYKNQCKIKYLLGLTHEKKSQIETKGGGTYAEWTKIVFTSMYHPRFWHMRCPDTERYALMRRFDSVREIEPWWERGGVERPAPKVQYELAKQEIYGHIFMEDK